MFFLDQSGRDQAIGLSHQAQSARQVAAWLMVCCVMVFGMIILGGVTRLTGSGLSMVDWQPIKGVIPPLTQADWQAAFDQYKQFPEFRYINQDMDLSGFKFIFLFEYGHRLLGRLIGIVFFLPMVWFWWQGKILKRYKPKLILMFVMGGMQGLLGWYMVKSGLVDDPHVSQYRLTAHLMLAVLIYGYMLYVARDLGELNDREPSWQVGSTRFESFLVVYILVMIASGGFVAGTHAGYIYNTFPLMNGVLFPDGLTALTPVWLNAFNNVLTIQFNHRWLAYGLIALVLFHRWRVNDASSPRLVAANWLMAAVAFQVGIGIITLLNKVPVALGALHQAGALVVFSASVMVLYSGRFDPGAVQRMVR